MTKSLQQMLKKIINYLFFREKWKLYYMSVDLHSFYDVLVIKEYKRKGKFKTVRKFYPSNGNRAIKKFDQLRELQRERQLLINKDVDTFILPTIQPIIYPHYVYLN